MGSAIRTTGGTGQVTGITMVLLIAIIMALQGLEGVLSLLPSLHSACLTHPLELVGDLDNCHIFYQCDINPQPRSCGNMLFNSLSQVCDWPSKVMQIRPECREETKLGLEHRPFYRQRTLRMMRNYGEGDRHSARRHRAPQDSNTISVAEVREKMIDHVYEIVELNERENREENSRQDQENSKSADAVKPESSVNSLERRPVPIFKVEDKSILAHSPVFAEETREYKPTWTRNSGCILGKCPKQRQRRLVKKGKRRLPIGERKILQERRRKLQETSSQDIIGSIADFKIINRDSLRN